MQPHPLLSTLPAAPALLLLWVFAVPSLAGDLQTERRIRDTLQEEASLQGELVSLQAGDTTFVAIHLPRRRGDARGAAMLLHGPWGHPDDPAIMRPLRLGLAEAGWDTLSVQMPRVYRHQDHAAWLAGSESLQARIGAASAWLKARGQLNQVVLTHGVAAVPALEIVAAGKAPDLQALVMISALIERDSPGMAALGKVSLPMLDVVAEHDLPGVRRNTGVRRAGAEADPEIRWTAREIAAATADFRGTADTLLAAVRAWLAANADGQTLNP